MQSVVKQVPVRDMLLIMGDFNARVGNDITTWRGTLGRFGPAEQNENGVKLLDFCALNDLAITNSFNIEPVTNIHGFILHSPPMQDTC